MRTERGAATSMWGAIIAGGGSRRMGGGHKFLLPLAGRPILAHAIARAAPQVAGLVLNTNETAADLPDILGFGLPIVTDSIVDYGSGGGPLMGVLACLQWLRRQHPAVTRLATFAADTPFFPRDLVARLAETASQSGDSLPVAAASGRRHPIFALWPVGGTERLQALVTEEGVLGVNEALDRLSARTVVFSGWPFDPFFNINTPEDLVRAEALVARQHDRPV